MLAGLAAQDSVHFLFLFLVSAHFSVRGTAPFLLTWEWDLAIFTFLVCFFSLSSLSSSRLLHLMQFFLALSFLPVCLCQSASLLKNLSAVCRSASVFSFFFFSPLRFFQLPSRPCAFALSRYCKFLSAADARILSSYSSLLVALPPRGSSLLFFSPCAINRAWGSFLSFP